MLAGCSAPAEEAIGEGKESANAGEVVLGHAFPIDKDRVAVSAKEVHPAITGLVTGPDGDVWLAGTFAGALDLGAGVIHAEAREAGFVARMDPSGRARWSTRIDGAIPSWGVALDRSGNAFVCGREPEQGSEVLLTKLAPGGAVIWRRPLFRAEGTGNVSLVVPDRAGGVVIVGWVEGTIQGGDVRIRRGGATFAAGADAEGRLRWANAFGRNSDDAAVAAAVDGEGNVIVAEENSVRRRAPLTKLGRSGSVVWRKMFRRLRRPGVAYGDVQPNAVAVDADGNVLFAGSGPTELDDAPAMSPTGGPWLIKLNPQGALLWLKDRRASLLGADAAGDVRLVDRTQQGFSAARLDVSGAPVWTRDFPRGGEPSTMVVDAAGRMIIAGTFHGAIEIGSVALSSGERDAIFLATLAP